MLTAPPATRHETREVIGVVAGISKDIENLRTVCIVIKQSKGIQRSQNFLAKVEVLASMHVQGLNAIWDGYSQDLMCLLRFLSGHAQNLTRQVRARIMLQDIALQ